MNRHLAPIATLFATLLLWGCSSEAPPAAQSGPVTLSRADSCHVCGMIVLDQQGPKGQARLVGGGKPVAFCSTTDLMAFLFQPDTPATVKEVWVHNMHEANWQSPPDNGYINAYEAWYVIEHDLHGAMGHTLAPFAEKQQAEAFIAKHGGKVLHYNELTLDIVAGMASYAFPDFDKVRDFDPEVELGGGAAKHH
ncbi:MAG: nitrous oxide reductase accessory protein NosL [Gammaproteobacteria bacterium]|nr:nitrous oxide reductase accessory protein NosL [Gammaproteobacteria bacterium]